jgi:hypothetical protein
MARGPGVTTKAAAGALVALAFATEGEDASSILLT